ncbi:MAG: uracil-DNA glycosylase family protein [Flavobacteriales bacterium]
MPKFKLIDEISKCEICKPFLELGPRPIVSIHEKSKIAIIGQAPGKAVHSFGIPWDDKSGNNLRKWLGISDETFYDPKEIALIPMGFCYPGKGKSGDLPPREECAPLWHDLLFEKMDNLKLVILIGTYAQDYYLKEKRKSK